jgi:hypothetical protein
MAETKTRPSSGRSKTTKRKATSKRKPSTQAAAKSKSKTKTRASKSRKTTPRSNGNGAGRVESARNAVEGTAKQAGHSVGDAGRSVGKVASKAKTPLLASGAALAGIAGGIAIGARGARQVKGMRRPKVKIGPKVKIDSHDLAKAAKEVGQFGMDVGQLASELRRNREQANGAKRRSPVEVVLEGLTHRGNGS